MAGERQITTVKNIAGSYAASPMQRRVDLSQPFRAAPWGRYRANPMHAAGGVECRRLLAGVGTRTDFPPDKCVHELFETQVERTPNAVALVYTKGEVSYRELDNQANRVAIHLRSLGVGPDVPVGICVQRSTDMAVGVLGILKAGGAYVPPDPAYPKERLAFMLEDSEAPVELTQKPLEGRFQFQIPNCREVCLESLRRTPGKTRTNLLRARRFPPTTSLMLSTSGQQRLWFLEQLRRGSPLYSIPIAVRLEGPLDATLLEQAVNQILCRHDVLRTRFDVQNGEPVQIVAPARQKTRRPTK